MIRMVTRLAHSRSSVIPGEPRAQNELRYGAATDWTLLPVNARRRFRILLEKQAEMARLSEESAFNRLLWNADDKSLGVIASGIAYNYVLESFREAGETPSILKVSTYPVPRGLIQKLVDHVETILVVEEGYPLIEKDLGGLFGLCGKTIRGKSSGHLPADGELSPEIVRRALDLPPRETVAAGKLRLAARPPQLCAGCPHADTFKALNKALEAHPAARVFSDIGCYTLGALPPHNAVDTCVCMGASIGMAKGASDAGLRPALAVIGDSTFLHSGITPLLDAAAHDTDMTVLILDNGTVAMTGQQPTVATHSGIESVVRGIGVNPEHFHVVPTHPKRVGELAELIRKELAHPGLSVIIAVRECIESARKHKAEGKAREKAETS